MPVQSTIERLVGGRPQLIKNPLLRRFWTPSGALVTPFTWNNEVAHFVPPPGWLTFGYVEPGFTSILAPSFDGVTPLRASTGSSMAYGTQITELLGDSHAAWGRAEPGGPGLNVGIARGRLGGLLQELANGKYMVGKRVRITGAYTVVAPDVRTDGGAGTPLGISLWAKTQLQEMPAIGDRLASTGFTVNRASASATCSALGSTFTNAAVLWAEGGRGVYQVDLSVSDTNPMIVGASADTYSGSDFVVGTVPPYGETVAHAHWMGVRGVFIPSLTYGMPGSVIKHIDPAKDFSSINWSVPGMDLLVQPVDGTGVHVQATDGAVTGSQVAFSGASSIPNAGGIPVFDTYLLLGGKAYGISTVSSTYVTLDGANGYPTNGLTGQRVTVISQPVLGASVTVAGSVLLHCANFDADAQEAYCWHQSSAPVSGTPGSTEHSTLWYVLAETWPTDSLPATVNATGTVKLLEDLTDDQTGAVHTFDAVVTISPDLINVEQGLYLIALPTNPDSFGDIHTRASVYWHSISVEPVPDADNEDVRTALLSDTVQDPQRDIDYGNLVPIDIQIDPAAARPVDSTYGSVYATVDGQVRFAAGSGGLDLMIPLPDLPPGSIIDTVTLQQSADYTATYVASQTVQWSLVGRIAAEVFTSTTGTRPLSATANTTSATQGIVLTGGSHSNLGSSTEVRAGLIRPVLGMPWPDFTSYDRLPSSAQTFGAQRWATERAWVRVQSSTAVSTWRVTVKHAAVRAWVPAAYLKGNQLLTWMAT